MEISKKELEVVHQTEAHAKDQHVFELTELQLLMIGGGSTVDSFH